MLKDEYKKLLSLIEQSTEPEKVSLEEILKEAVVFFEVLRKEFPSAPKEEREEMIEMMTHLHAKIQAISKKVAEETGLTEEDLYAVAENPSNFTPEQWQIVQETKRRLYDSARKFSSAMETERPPQAPENQEPKEKKPPIRPRTRRPRRKEWKKT